MNGGSLFSGIGGLDLGLEAWGVEPTWLCESDPDCRRILERHYPGVPVYPDVREIGEGTPRVAVLHGGFPCQDISVAGKGAGILEGTRSGLWLEFARAIRVLRPRYVVVENVAALVHRGLGIVLADLAEAGYDATWACLRASDVGAPHRRERVFIVATDADDGRREQRDAGERGLPVPREGGAQPTPDADLIGLEEPARAGADAASRDRRAAPDGGERGERRSGRRTQGGADARAGAQERDGRGLVGEGEQGPCGCPWDFIDADGFCACCEAHIDDARGLYAVQGDGTHRLRGCPLTADAASVGRVGRPHGARGDGEPGQEAERAEGNAAAAHGGHDAWGAYGVAIQRWEAVLGRHAPRPTDDRGRLAPEFVEWMMGFPEGWTEGVSRTARLRMLGNAVQVQVAEVVGYWLAQMAGEGIAP